MSFWPLRRLYRPDKSPREVVKRRWIRYAVEKEAGLVTGIINNVKIKLLICLFLLLFLVLSVPGCDRKVIIRGKVYEWVEPPAGTISQIYHKGYNYQGLLNEDLPAEADLQPLKNVQVQCYGTVKTDTFYSNEITNEKGEYKLMISVGQLTQDYPTTIEASKSGYQSAKRDLVDKGSDHTVNIILIKEQ